MRHRGLSCVLVLVSALGCATGSPLTVGGVGGGGNGGASASSAGPGGGTSSSSAASSVAVSSSNAASSSSGGPEGPCGVEPQAGLAAWYRFEDTTGPVCDASGNGNHGTVEGSGLMRGAPGKHGTAISFTGTDGRVHVPASASLDMITAGTIELWVRLGSTSSIGSTVSRGTGNNDNNVLMNSSCGDMQTIFTNGGSINVTSACSAIPAQTWTHIAVVNNGSNAVLYINGALDTSAPGGHLGSIANDLYIGQREQGVFPFDGTIDEIKWWTTARKPQEICGDAGGTWAQGVCDLP